MPALRNDWEEKEEEWEGGREEEEEEEEEEVEEEEEEERGERKPKLSHVQREVDEFTIVYTDTCTCR